MSTNICSQNNQVHHQYSFISLKMSGDLRLNDRNNNNEFICGVVEGFYGKPWTCDQRKDLFKRLRDFKLNAFMYAPKDDAKHRAKWRQLYSEAEAAQLKALIDEAKLYGIDFYYSLAPGLDMVYSDKEELDLLIRKYDQLVGLGCQSFAILFDDIEPSINERDKEMFKSYAAAQVSVTNVIYEHLKRPKFLFCPTEYCESRAVPNVTNSSYLNTLGAGLLENIDIMWSGPRVISRLITEESIETLTKVIRRPPVIWENLHANDYDKKRVFLGPYSGRSTKIIPKLKGVLTNPNCEYEANYIAIHTLAQWSKCTEDTNAHNRCDSNQGVQCPSNAQIKCSIEQTTSIKSVYDPNLALAFAIRDWLPLLKQNRILPIGINVSSQPNVRSDESASNQLAKETLDDREMKDTADAGENIVEMVPEETQSSSANSVSTNKSEMDTSSSPVQTNDVVDANSCESYEMQDAVESSTPVMNKNSENVPNQRDSSFADCIACSVSSGAPSNDQSSLSLISFENLSLLVDLFYLPFEHGSYGYTLLRDIKWLRDNSGVLLSQNMQDPNAQQQQQQQNQSSDSLKESLIDEESGGNPVMTSGGPEAMKYWIERAERLNNLCACISRLVNTLIVSLNICLFPDELLIVILSNNSTNKLTFLCSTTFFTSKPGNNSV